MIYGIVPTMVSCHEENSDYSYVTKTSNPPPSVSLAMLHNITLTIRATKDVLYEKSPWFSTKTDMKTHREMTTSSFLVRLTAVHLRDKLSGLGDLENMGGITERLETKLQTLKSQFSRHIPLPLQEDYNNWIDKIVLLRCTNGMNKNMSIDLWNDIYFWNLEDSGWQ